MNFSVITVVRNDLEGLKKSRKSLEDQYFKNWKHVIVDGASTDGTIEYLKTLSVENTIFISEPDNGIYSAMNKGWKLCEKNSHVFYLNARDTFATEESLTQASAALSRNPLSKWGCTTHEEIAQSGEGWVCKLVSPPSVANQLYAFGYRSHQGVVMKASFLEEVGGFDEKYLLAADWDLIAKALKISNPTTWVYPLGRFELGGESSNHLLAAHIELMAIRRVHLNSKGIAKFADRIWCAIYLRELGYKNFLSRIILIIYPRHKIFSMEAGRHSYLGHFILFLKSQRKNSGKFVLIGKILRAFQKIREKFRTKFILVLQKVLNIQPIMRPPELEDIFR